jgi:selenocysteine-specific elongation factor
MLTIMSDIERSISIGLLGANHAITKLVGESFGSPGTKSDLQFYNRVDSGLNMVFTAVAPIAYPEKIKSLLQTCAETQIHIMLIDAEVGITAEVGEIMVAMDLFCRLLKTKYIAAIGGITGANEWRIEEIQQKLPLLLKSTTLADMEIHVLHSKEAYKTLKQKVSQLTLEIPYPDPKTAPYSKVLIDHVFPVQGIGTVALGLVTQGQIVAGQMYDMVPVQNKVILRSIQKQDRDFKTAEAGDRVGLALKGLKPDKIDRNAIFCSLNAMKTSQKFPAEVYISPFYKPLNEQGIISPTDSKTYHVVADLGISAVKFEKGDDIAPGKEGTLFFNLEKPLVHDSHGMKGIIADFGPFDKKLRIVGFFKQQMD